eukprot:CAMPEP_0172774068 /NCGR_PEP_ID=MMETSP1074-20121228/195464_1 /TAXON_ID=2916 /ORGANISM="Ceratium fusus, Strain PA161109" /LENGTH=47 /DNA_ID= /DNA_START= /DNA_END= /DNA_ORIENTATION=
MVSVADLGGFLVSASSSGAIFAVLGKPTSNAWWAQAVVERNGNRVTQ